MFVVVESMENTLLYHPFFFSNSSFIYAISFFIKANSRINIPGFNMKISAVADNTSEGSEKENRRIDFYMRQKKSTAT